MRTWIAAAAVAIALPGVALAGEAADCQMAAKAMCAPAASAKLSSASGDVLLSRGGGFSEIKAGASLVAGDRLLVKKGAANLALGPSCQAQLGANSMVTIVERDGVLCAAQLASDPETVAQGAVRCDDPRFADHPSCVGPGFDLPTAGLVVGGLTVATFAILANRGRAKEHAAVLNFPPRSPF